MEGREEEGFAVLPEWADLGPVRCALPLLQSMPWAPGSPVLRRAAQPLQLLCATSP